MAHGGGSPARHSTHKYQLMRSLAIRTAASVVILAIVGAVLLSSHMAVALMILGVQIAMYREITGISMQVSKERRTSMTPRVLSWYLMGATLYFLYGRMVYRALRQWVGKPPHTELLSLLARYHLWHSFLLYVGVFVWFVKSLRRATLRYQLRQMTWSIMTLVIILFQCRLIVKNVYTGIFWIVMPHTLIMVNDTAAYLFGVLLGRRWVTRSLTRLSPNKTWEGFIGGLVVTLIAAVLLTPTFANYDWFRCSYYALQTSKTCPRTPLYTWRSLRELVPVTIPLPPVITELEWAPIQGHSLIFALFASLVSPFSGFFASAIKRAYDRKDFDSIIPGHGGITDRFDCQILMGIFTHVYVSTFLRSSISLDLHETISAVRALSNNERAVVLAEILRTQSANCDTLCASAHATCASAMQFS